MQRTEVLEAEEFFSKGQKGSSAMPHKRNPVLTENLTGLARLVRMAVVPAMENVALWHERDTQKGVSREDSYRLVQRNAMRVWEEGADFLTELKADEEVMAAMTEAEIEEKFDLGYHTKHVDTIFERVFGS